MPPAHPQALRPSLASLAIAGGILLPALVQERGAGWAAAEGKRGRETRDEPSLKYRSAAGWLGGHTHTTAPSAGSPVKGPQLGICVAQRAAPQPHAVAQVLHEEHWEQGGRFHLRIAWHAGGTCAVRAAMGHSSRLAGCTAACVGARTQQLQPEFWALWEQPTCVRTAKGRSRSDLQPATTCRSSLRGRAATGRA